MTNPVPEASVLTRSQPTEADVREVASILDHPSVYMGGPSRDSMRRAKAIVDLIWQRAQAALPVPAGRKATGDIDHDALLAWLENPPPPNDALRALYRGAVDGLNKATDAQIEAAHNALQQYGAMNYAGVEAALNAALSLPVQVKRAADARGDWDAGKLAALRVDARSAGELDRATSRQRRERIEALGDSNPPHMAEAIGLAIASAMPCNHNREGPEVGNG